MPKIEPVLIKDTICSDEEYVFNGKLITETGIYTDTIKNNIILDRNINEEEFLNVCKKILVSACTIQKHGCPQG